MCIIYQSDFSGVRDHSFFSHSIKIHKEQNIHGFTVNFYKYTHTYTYKHAYTCIDHSNAVCMLGMRSLSGDGVTSWKMRRRTAGMVLRARCKQVACTFTSLKPAAPDSAETKTFCDVQTEPAGKSCKEQEALRQDISTVVLQPFLHIQNKKQSKSRDLTK